jgi:adenine phosphoribosyltransferase
VVLIDDLIATGGTMMAGKPAAGATGRAGDRRRGHRRPARTRWLGRLRESGLALFTLVDFAGH